jgi:quinol-cytochrome oxidoreductase complex cytochrome b subunit
MAMGQKVYHWLDTRLSLTPYREWGQHKTVPVHRQSFWYYLGGIVLVFLLLQFATGVLLMVYYVPEIKSAHLSILNINSQVDFGWFFRSLHSWGANLLVLSAFLHMFSTYFMKAYRPPREITWWSGLLLMGLVFGFGFSGYLLPWDQIAFFATKVGIDIAEQVPLLGEQIALLLRGGSTISQATLSRFFTLHVIVLPLALLPILGLHLMMIQIQGTSEPDWFKKLPPEKQVTEPFFPTFVLKDLMGWMAVVNLLAILVALFPWGVGEEAEPFQPAPPGIKPEWYFLFMFQFFKLLPPHIGPLEGEQFGMLLFGLVILSLILLPFWDSGKSEKRSRWTSIYGIVLVGLFVILTVWGALT